ncbi:hypothetical protein MBM_07584 [Drepanopeziza brunnea f. sp. 'multigermtubi' MB_m1]|uniref:Putative zinc-finger domain-containing protein n=1 Tax=Marssonina brunnea f. sp. multigermtubi (strain MB_m1) TaxID=1072389 RepID=K1XPC0_MARBU|nr:uncharacterized protein MBM_07584 [Drepanopeziza brunnea f. sp. 'multigermtubi' MB_m1]EKD14354.1 hypothetical protein MBM_07584 [Drepanopeziza brunnea f. sp. 'multigermtubi' MB_m1]
MPSYGYRDQQAINPQYLPPTYPNQYDSQQGQPQMAPHYDAAMAAYGYNRAAPSFSASAIASGVPPLPIFQGWNQDSMPLPPYTTPQAQTQAQAPTQYTGYNNTAFNSNAQQNTQYYAPTAQPSYQQQAPEVRPYEQGEQREGGFDDEITRATHTPSAGYGAPQYLENGGNSSGGTGYTDSAQRAVYSKPRDYTPGMQEAILYENVPQLISLPANSYSFPPRDSSQSRSQQTGSYPPYVPQSGTGYEELPKPGSYKQSQNGWSHNGAHGSVDADAGSSIPLDNLTNGYQQPSKRKFPSVSGNIDDQLAGQSNRSRTLGKAGFTSTPGNVVSQVAGRTNGQANGHRAGLPVISKDVDNPQSEQRNGIESSSKSTVAANFGDISRVAEIRKKAQGAILNLWPYDVRYQTYIDEGFSEEVIGSLFDELKMSRNPPANITTNSSGKMGNSSPQKENEPEDRNQKENRALEENNVQLAAKPAALTEKEKALQSKLEALRKSREERAQRAAAKIVNKPQPQPPLPTTVPTSPADPPKYTPPTITTTTQSAPLLTSVSPLLSKTQPQSKKIDASSTSSTMVMQQQTSIIPGLFLASPAAANTPTATPTTAPSTMPPLNDRSVRKRPVAADFDKPIPTAAPYKRPFGQSRVDHTLVIDVSDEEEEEEEEDVAMDLESQADQDSPVMPTTNMAAQRSSSFPNPSLTTRQHITPSPNLSAKNTPPASGAAVNYTAGVQDLGRVENELKELKKKIADAERRQKAKQNVNARQPAPINPGPSKVDALVNTQKKAEIADTKIALEQQRVFNAKADESAKAEEVKKIETEQKRLRRAKIAADLPRVDAAVFESRSKLEQIRAQLAEAEAEHQRELEGRRLLDEEMKRLGEEAEEHLQSEKDKLNQLNQQASASSEEPSHSSSTTTAGVEVFKTPQSDQDPPASSEVVMSPGLPEEPVTIDSGTQAVTNLSTGLGEVLSAAHTQVVSQGQAQTSVDHTIKQVDGLDVVAPAEEPTGSKGGISTDRALEAALQEAVRADTDAHANGEDDMDIDDFYAPDPSQLPSESVSEHMDKGTHSPEYSPELDRTIVKAPDREPDDYEPPEAAPPDTDMEEPYSPPFSPAPPQITDSVPAETSASTIPHVSETLLPKGTSATNLNDVQADVVEDGEISNTPEVDTAQAVANEVGRSKEKALDSVAVLPQVSQMVEVSSESCNKPDFYTPYESPLKRFAAYRFHPNFKQDIAGGLRSKTYSHKIQPNQEFCRWELSGGICNDATCEEQHFRDIALPDDAILTALGSPAEFTGEQRELFCAGLRAVLLDLRVRKIRDFEIIAAEIVAHRAKFLGDKSKVLATLEGTTI